APFDALAPDELAEVAAQATIEFHLRGAVILSEDAGPVTSLRVIHSGAVDITHQGRLLDLLGPGDMFGHAAMLSGLPPGFEAHAGAGRGPDRGGDRRAGHDRPALHRPARPDRRRGALRNARARNPPRPGGNGTGTARRGAGGRRPVRRSAALLVWSPTHDRAS